MSTEIIKYVSIYILLKKSEFTVILLHFHLCCDGKLNCQNNLMLEVLPLKKKYVKILKIKSE